MYVLIVMPEIYIKIYTINFNKKYTNIIKIIISVKKKKIQKFVDFGTFWTF